MSQVISSEQNKIYKDLIQLHSSAGIKKQKQYLVFGEKVIFEYLSNHKASARLIMSESFSTSQKHDDFLSSTGIHSPLKTILTNELFKNLDLFNTKFPILQCELPDFEEWESSKPPSEPSLICALGEPSNLGAVIRCADAFGINKIILTLESSFPFHPKALRASSGSFQRIQFLKGPSIENIKTEVISLDMNGEQLGEFKWPSAFYLLVGEEGQGVPQSILGQRVSIPMGLKTESLNAAVSIGIALYDFRLKHPLK